jgi:hypothetical protein
MNIGRSAPLAVETKGEGCGVPAPLRRFLDSDKAMKIARRGGFELPTAWMQLWVPLAQNEDAAKWSVTGNDGETVLGIDVDAKTGAIRNPLWRNAITSRPIP